MATHLAGQCNPEASSSLDLSLLVFQKLNEHLEQFVLGNFRSNTGTQLIDVLRYHIPDSPRTVHGTRLNDGEHKLELLASWQHLGQGNAVLTSQQPAREQSRVRMQLGAKGGRGDTHLTLSCSSWPSAANVGTISAIKCCGSTTEATF